MHGSDKMLSLAYVIMLIECSVVKVHLLCAHTYSIGLNFFFDNQMFGPAWVHLDLFRILKLTTGQKYSCSGVVYSSLIISFGNDHDVVSYEFGVVSYMALISSQLFTYNCRSRWYLNEVTLTLTILKLSMIS